MVLDVHRMGEMHAAFARLRDYTDYTYVCDLTVEDGILDRVRALIIPMGGFYKTATLKKIRSFAERGGLIVGINLDTLCDLNEGLDYLDILFGENGKEIGQGYSLLIRGQMGGKIGATATPSGFHLVGNDPGNMQTEICDQMTSFFATHGLYVSDGVMDGVFTAERNGKILAMNYSGKDVERDFTKPDGTSSSVRLLVR